MKRKKIVLQQMIGRAGSVVYEMQSMNYSGFDPHGAWQPAMNAYQFTDRFEVAVELPGIEHKVIDVLVEPRRLVVKGTRPATESDTGDQPCHVLAMEIANGPFLRELSLPIDVDVEHTVARRDKGMLWITLPFK